VLSGIALKEKIFIKKNIGGTGFQPVLAQA